MLGILKRHEVKILLKAGHSKTDVARLPGVSLSSVRRIAEEAPVVDKEIKPSGTVVPLTADHQKAITGLISLLKVLTSPGGTRLVAETRGAFGRVAAPVTRLINRATLSALTFFGSLDARRGGMIWAVIIVSALFLSVHVPQYQNNLAVIAAVGMLSVALTTVRAVTGRVLPCFIIHLVFNGVQVAGLIYTYFYPGKPAADATSGLFALAHEAQRFLF